MGKPGATEWENRLRSQHLLYLGGMGATGASNPAEGRAGKIGERARRDGRRSKRAERLHLGGKISRRISGVLSAVECFIGHDLSRNVFARIPKESLGDVPSTRLILYGTRRRLRV